MSETAALWPDVAQGFAHVHRAAHILGNKDQAGGSTIRRRYRKFVQTMTQDLPVPGELRRSLEHFLKVTQSYEPGLFHCYDVADLPRTNNALEQLFGATRYHERRCTGRKVASPSLVLRGSVRIIAGIGTRLRLYGGEELAPANLDDWRKLRHELETRRQTRALRYRFRRDPAGFLHQLQLILLKAPLPT